LEVITDSWICLLGGFSYTRILLALSPGHSRFYLAAIEKNQKRKPGNIATGNGRFDYYKLSPHYELSSPIAACDVAMIPGFRPIFLYGSAIKSRSGLGTRLGFHLMSVYL